MALWGSPFGLGFPWGGVDPGPVFACALVEDRVLVQHPDAIGERKLRDWLCAFAEQAGEYLDVAQEVKEAFDVDLAVGAQLDLIGSIVDLPRSGVTDVRYRVLLNIQIKLLIGRLPGNPDWTGTVNNILEICRLFIGVAVVAPVVLRNTPPYSYILTIPGVSIVDLDVLVRFICRATWAGVLGQVIFQLDSLTFCNEIAADVAFPSILCNEIAADTVGAGLFAHVVLIGTEPC